MHKYLENIYNNALKISFNSNVIILSDCHRGIRNDSDDFKNCEQSYINALNYYLKNNYQLILLGDIEELWEENIKNVIKKNDFILKLESEFYKKDKYFRIVGNHDIYWKNKKNINKYLDFYMKSISNSKYIQNSMILKHPSKDIFLFHGHQEDLFSSKFWKISKFFVKTFWRTYQLITNKKLTKFRTNIKKVSKFDKNIYNWAQDKYYKNNLLTIIGHTHRPVWLSKTHVQQLYEYFNYEKIGNDYIFLSKEYKKYISLRYELNFDSRKYIPCYFNVGCCSFSDGDITGIEITNKDMKLIKFSNNSQSPIILANNKF